MSGLPKFKPYLEKLGHSYDPTNSENSVSGTDQYTTLRLAVERYPWTAELYHQRKAALGCLRHSLERQPYFSNLILDHMRGNLWHRVLILLPVTYAGML